MEADLQAYVAFYLTGKKQPTQFDEIVGLKLRPALFSGYRDLTRLRYDFPLVLIDDATAGRYVESLSALIDSVLSKVANGANGERIRKHVLRLEQETRTQASRGSNLLLSELWEQAAAKLIKKDPLIADSLSLARANLKIDGEVIDCAPDLSFRLLGHIWGNTQMKRAKKFNTDINRLILKLSEILQADFANSDAGKSADNLKHAFGSGPLDAFDFAAMSRILKKATPRENLSKARRQRVSSLIATLQSQKFFPTTATLAGAKKSTSAPYSFAFESCSTAVKAYCERLPKAIELAKAIAVAELEIKGEYNEAKHDALFESYGKNGLIANELALFPDYLVRLNATDLSGPEQNTLTEILAADLPIKILVQSDDILEKPFIDNGHIAFALRSKQLASSAMGMSGVFVLQAPASSLYQLRQQLQQGLDFSGPALFSLYSGASPHTSNLPPYLVSAAALESRAFPAFCFNPSAGSNWATRFSLPANPQAANDWPIRKMVYQDERFQTVEQNAPFTLIDFVACDSRYSKHFARIPQASTGATLAPVAEILAKETGGAIDTVPYLMMIDSDNRLQKVLVDETLIHEARRCLNMWNSLQELGGINNSHAEKLLASEKQAWEATAKAAEAIETPVVTATTTAPAQVALVPAASEVEAEPSSDEAYIETARCSSCNECVQFNAKMFAYDGNKQAFIADAKAGTFAQLVEAAENCPVAIIHPGKPLNPNEAGLDELIKRAEAFS
ncbi:MAG: ferredoxin [Betaproteobacteria bacterium]